MQILYYSFLAD